MKDKNVIYLIYLLLFFGVFFKPVYTETPDYTDIYKFTIILFTVIFKFLSN